MVVYRIKKSVTGRNNMNFLYWQYMILFLAKNMTGSGLYFLNDVPITDKRAAKIYKSALMEIFPESDRTDSDIPKMYYGGKEVLYFAPFVPMINMEWDTPTAM